MSEVPSYSESVFINCPFDDQYKPLFEAIVFCVFDCGFFPRCALEISNGVTIRIHKIMDIVESCKLAIHDISRTELNANGLPRFNMPLELGIFFGAQRFGLDHHKEKSCIVLDLTPHRYQQFISDISGQDVTAHGGDPKKAITEVRNWLLGLVPNGKASLPGGTAIYNKFVRFSSDLPDLCARLQLDMTEYTFIDYARMAGIWLQERNAG